MFFNWVSSSDDSLPDHGALLVPDLLPQLFHPRVVLLLEHLHLIVL